MHGIALRDVDRPRLLNLLNRTSATFLLLRPHQVASILPLARASAILVSRAALVKERTLG